MSGPTCTCASIQAADGTRHFRECPLRAKDPEGPAATPESGGAVPRPAGADSDTYAAGYAAGHRDGAFWAVGPIAADTGRKTWDLEKVVESALKGLPRKTLGEIRVMALEVRDAIARKDRP